MNHLKNLFILAFVASLTACSSAPERSAGDMSGSDMAPGLNGGAEMLGASGGLATDGGSMGQSLDGMKMVDIDGLNEPVIYFGYNQFELDDKTTAIVKFYAQSMIANPRQKVVVQGHTDERGTPEYNLALGERRAKTVAQALMLFGISASRIEVVSFGEEKPADTGKNENAWTKNRRVELIIG